MSTETRDITHSPRPLFPPPPPPYQMSAQHIRPTRKHSGRHGVHEKMRRIVQAFNERNYEAMSGYVIADPEVLQFEFDGGKTFLHLAAEKADQQMLHLLLTKDANPNKTDHLGCSPFLLFTRSLICSHSKSEEGLEVLNTFIRMGARGDLPNTDGESAQSILFKDGDQKALSLCCGRGFKWEQAIIASFSLPFIASNHAIAALALLVRENEVAYHDILKPLLAKECVLSCPGLRQLFVLCLSHCEYSDFWVDYLSEDTDRSSVKGKLDQIGKAELMRSHLSSSKKGERPKFQLLIELLGEASRLQRTSSMKIPSPRRRRSITEGARDPSKVHSWGHDVRPRPLLIEPSRPGSLDSFVSCRTKEDLCSHLKKGALAVVKNELKTPWVNQRLSDGSFLLHHAVETVQPKMVDLLLERGAQTNVWKDEGTNNPLQSLLQSPTVQREVKKTTQILESLLKYGADSVWNNQRGTSALELVLGLGEISFIQPFLAYRLDWMAPLQKLTRGGKFPQNDAQKQVVQYLIQQEVIEADCYLKLLLSLDLTSQVFSEPVRKIVKDLLSFSLGCRKLSVETVIEHLASDTSEQSLIQKIDSFKGQPYLFGQVIEAILAQRKSVIQSKEGNKKRLYCRDLLRLLLQNKPEGCAPDYNKVFDDADEASRETKITLLIEARLLSSERKANDLARLSPDRFTTAEALGIGLPHFLKGHLENKSIAWEGEILEFAKKAQSLSVLQLTGVQHVCRARPRVYMALVTRLLEESFLRTNEHQMSSFEMLLSALLCMERVPGPDVHCARALNRDRDPKSLGRKLDICRKHLAFSDPLKQMLGQIRVESPQLLRFVVRKHSEDHSIVSAQHHYGYIRVSGKGKEKAG